MPRNTVPSGSLGWASVRECPRFSGTGARPHVLLALLRQSREVLSACAERGWPKLESCDAIVSGDDDHARRWTGSPEIPLNTLERDSPARYLRRGRPRQSGAAIKPFHARDRVAHSKPFPRPPNSAFQYRPPRSCREAARSRVLDPKLERAPNRLAVRASGPAARRGAEDVDRARTWLLHAVGADCPRADDDGRHRGGGGGHERQRDDEQESLHAAIVFMRG